MKDILNVAVVNFYSEWGNKDKNLSKIIEYVETAAQRGANLILFPETALTGYDDDTDNSGENKMHRLLSEPIPGPSTNAIANIAKKYNVYVVVGMSERDPNNTNVVYNAAAAIGPEGVIGSYRKLHLPFTEANWAQRGVKPFTFTTPWGPIGISICYDTYVFSEIMRYYRAKGCRLVVNPTAVNTNVTANNVKDSIEYLSANNAIYIASANLIGLTQGSKMIGGSSIIGPSINVPEVFYYGGTPFDAPKAAEEELHIATIDLSITEKPFLAKQWSDDEPDWRPEIYMEMYKEIANTEKYLNKKY